MHGRSIAVSSLSFALLALACSPSVSEQEAQTARLACKWKAGALPKDTLASDAPLGGRIPIEHIVLIMQENHSFDNYFSGLAGVQTAVPNVTNPGLDGAPVTRFHFSDYCHDDTNHSWNGAHEEYDDGLNDGFVKANAELDGGTDPTGSRAMGYYDESDLPYYYALARAFAISDAHHCSLLGPTVPNRMFAMAGTSWGLITNDVAPLDSQGNPYPNLMSMLDNAKISWKAYIDKKPGGAPPDEAVFVQTWLADSAKFVTTEDFANDVAAGNLPQVSIVEGFTHDQHYDSEDEHPPADSQIGQAWVAGILAAIMASPNWPSTAVFLSWDEHGGFYDSVPPPSACAPDSFAAIIPMGSTVAGFNRYGFRVPMIVVSPYAKHGYISHHVTDHTSVLRFIEARFGLPALTARDANADPLFDMFDFDHPDTTVPTLPDATIDQDKEKACTSEYP
jgi:phospholipase C